MTPTTFLQPKKLKKVTFIFLKVTLLILFKEMNNIRKNKTNPLKKSKFCLISAYNHNAYISNLLCFLTRNFGL